MSNIIDFHTHVLPGIDDGSSSLQESIAMLRVEAEQGIHHVVATPHFYAQHDKIKDFLQKRRVAKEKLQEEMAKYDNMPVLGLGAEVYFFRGISESDVLKDLTIDGKNYILIEMPHVIWNDSMYRDLEAIYTKQGLTPVIAHIDRYLGRFRTYGIPERLAELPVLVQANASFFCNRSTAGLAMRMLQKEQIHLLGSDCHSMGSRCPNLGMAVEIIQNRLGQSAMDHIVELQKMVMN